MPGLDDIDPSQPPSTEDAQQGASRIRTLEAKTIEFAAVEHALSGEHQFLVGPLASRPAAGHAGRFYIITTTGLPDDLQYDTGSSWITLTSVAATTAVVAALLAHRTQAVIDHPDVSVTSAKVALGAILKKHLDGSSDLTSLEALVGGESADALHSHAQYQPLLSVGGVLPSDLSDLTAGDIVIGQANTQRTFTGLTFAMIKEIKLNRRGTISTSFDLTVTGGDYGAARIYKNGTPFGTEHGFNGGGSGTFTENLAFSAGDLVQLWVKMYSYSSGIPSYVQNFKLYANWDTTVNTD